MTRTIRVESYAVYVAATSLGFNEWRANIYIHTEEPGTYCDLRFVDDTATVAGFEDVQETGPSQIYLPYTMFGTFLDYLQTEQPLHVSLFGPPDNRVTVQTGAEPPGEREASS